MKPRQYITHTNRCTPLFPFICRATLCILLTLNAKVVGRDPAASNHAPIADTSISSSHMPNHPQQPHLPPSSQPPNNRTGMGHTQETKVAGDDYSCRHGHIATWAWMRTWLHLLALHTHARFNHRLHPLAIYHHPHRLTRPQRRLIVRTHTTR